MNGPLSKYRIIDLTTMVSGPYGTQLLGDQGADVIKVETLGGDLMRWAGPSRGGLSSAFLLNNRSKRSITLDLKQAEGKAILDKLIESADVFAALSGDHEFTRFNPAIGITTKLSEQLGAYIGYAETNRTPSPVELTCADPADPCRLPNAFLAYPPLELAVS